MNTDELLELENTLETLRKQPSDIELVKTLNVLAYNGLYYFPPEKAESLAREAVSLAEQQGNDQELAKGLLTLGIVKLDTGSYAEAMSLCRKSMKIYRAINDMKGYGAVQGTMGNIFWAQGMIDNALEHYLACLKTKREYNASDDVLASSYYNIASCYLRLGNLNEGEEAFEFVRSVWEKSDDPAKLAFVYNNLGALYKERGDSLTALDYLGKALEIRLETGQKKNAASTLSSIGDLYQELGNIKESLDCFSRSIDLFESINNKRGVAYAMCNIGRLHSSSGRFDEAEKFISEALSISTEMNLSEYIVLCLEQKMDMYEAMGDFRKALESARELKAKQTDFLNRENMDKIAKLQVQFETEKKEREAEIYRLKNVELTEKNELLQRALEHVRNLQGLLPICAHCKKIRDDSGYWEQIESYITKHSETEFSHSICPECLEKYYSNPKQMSETSEESH